MKPTPYLLSLLVGFACSTSTPPATVQLPNSLKIASITVAGTPEANTWTRDNPINLTLSCVPGVPLIVDIDPKIIDSALDSVFTLQAPGNCGSLVSCGWLELRVVPSDGAEIDVATDSAPITVNGIDRPGTYDIELELHDASDNVLHWPNGDVVGDKATVNLSEPTDCAASNEADAG